MLVRVSSIDDSTVTAYGLHDRFVLDLLATLTYGDRVRLAGRPATRTPSIPNQGLSNEYCLHCHYAD